MTTETTTNPTVNIFALAFVYMICLVGGGFLYSLQIGLLEPSIFGFEAIPSWLEIPVEYPTLTMMVPLTIATIVIFSASRQKE